MSSNQKCCEKQGRVVNWNFGFLARIITLMSHIEEKFPKEFNLVLLTSVQLIVDIQGTMKVPPPTISYFKNVEMSFDYRKNVVEFSEF